jgi:hypothetical protein
MASNVIHLGAGRFPYHALCGSKSRRLRIRSWKGHVTCKKCLKKIDKKTETEAGG